jgi:hypothetical protein
VNNMMKLKILFLLSVFALFVGRANAQVLGGSAVTFTSRLTAPSGLVTGLWNHSGVLTLKCSGCVTVLSAPGIIESTSGGFKFPDTTIQTTAATTAGSTFWSSVNMWNECVDASGNANPPAIGVAQEKDGQRFYFSSPPPGKTIKVTGVRFIWNGPNKTIRTALFQAHANTFLTSVDVNTTGTATYESVFASPITITPYVSYTVSIYETSASNNIQPCAPNGANAANNGLLNFPFSASSYRVVTNHYFCGGACASTNTTQPTSQLSTSQVFPIEPIFTVE